MSGRARNLLAQALSSLLVCGAIVIVSAPLVATGGCAQEETTTGAPPAADAEIQEVVLNVFGMT